MLSTISAISFRIRFSSLLYAFAAFVLAWNACSAKEFTLTSSAGKATVSCTRHNGMWYAPLGALANTFQRTAHYRDSATVVAIEGYTITTRIDNPFVKVTDIHRSTHIYQFSFAPFTESGNIYVPVSQFVDILILATPFDIQFNREDLSAVFSVERHHAVAPVAISSVAIEGRNNGYVINITFEKSTPADISAKLEVNNHVIVHLPAFTFDTANTSYSSGDLKDEIALDSPGEGTLSFTLSGETKGISGIRKDNIYTVLIRAKRKTVSPIKKAEHDKWKLDVIVLDAGHGGKDPGAEGVYGTKEKDVALGVVLKLGKLLEDAGYKVVYTRKTDTFIELNRRGQIANEAKGKLFICIHCNSMPIKPNPANGIESYILRPGKTESAARVAARENSVVKFENDAAKYANMTEENFIVAPMAQSSFVRWSERFAALVQQNVTKVVPTLKNNGVSQAGFIVLIGASMPNILIETGYISNPKEERFLGSKSGQTKLAEGIFDAVQKYKQEYEKTIAQ